MRNKIANTVQTRSASIAVASRVHPSPGEGNKQAPIRRRDGVFLK